MSEAITCLQHEDEPPDHVADIVIIGAGISGTLAATVLARGGYRVTIVDRYKEYPTDFRAEHLDGTQIDQFARLGLLDDLTAGLYRGETVACGRRGRLIEIGKTINFGLRYDQMVNIARRLMPTTVTSVIGRVVDVVTSDTIQQVRLADGHVLRGRLLIVAAGLGYALCRRLGITRKMVREAHSLTFGFSITPKDRAAFEHSYVVYQGEKVADRIDYLALFRLGDQTRANLFTFRDYRDPWTTAFRADPARCLKAALPGLTKLIGDFDVSGKVEVRAMDLYMSEGHVRDGVVLIGDAFQTACPAAGTGITKILTDIERLCLVHIPEWLRTDGIGQAKIAAFYNDPIKRACDAKSAHDAEYRRSVTIEPGLKWMIHRQQVHARRRVRVLVSQWIGSVGAWRTWNLPGLRAPGSTVALGIMDRDNADHVI
ncbi:FAD-dependent oxidoreductase [Rhodopila sp.]|uniref:FAD-dependent oxidoreductase n=1 Tax=Rhodopila sp. TaxID=2480087 RepID=UPI003D144D1B